jgi:outer membrane protein TolC
VNLRATILALASLTALPVHAAELQPITLRDAVLQAQARHPSAQVAAAEIARASAVLEQVHAAFLPTVTGTGSYTRLDGDRVLAGRTLTSANQLYASVSLLVPLISPQRWVAWHHAEDQVAVAQASAAEVRWQVGVAAARAYLGVLAQTRVVEALARARETAAAHLKFAQGRRRGGLGNRIDEVRAGQELATADGQFRGAEALLEKQREQLGVLTASDVALSPADEAPLPTALPQDPTESGHRPDLQALQQRLRAAEKVRQDSRVDWWPTLSASLAPFVQAPAIVPQPSFGYQAQLLLTVPIFDAGLRQGQRREREALVGEAAAQLHGVERQAQSEVRAAVATIGKADEALLSARQAETLAQQALDLAQQAWQAGVSTNLEVVDAERRARDAATARVQAEDVARQARLDLLVARGEFP